MKDYIQCLKCGSCINIDTKSQYIECACGAIAVDGNKDYTRVIGEMADWKHIKEEE